MPPTYETASGTKYSIDDQNQLLRNGVLFAAWGEPLHYIGMADSFATAQTFRGADVSQTMMIAKSTKPEDPQHTLYLLYAQGKINITQVPFDEIGAHIDGRLGLIFTGDGIQKLMQTTPIKSQSQ